MRKLKFIKQKSLWNKLMKKNPMIRVTMTHNFTESKRNSLTVINFMYIRFNMYHALAYYVTCHLVRHFLYFDSA